MEPESVEIFRCVCNYVLEQKQQYSEIIIKEEIKKALIQLGDN
jgi:hypothetical protein